MFELVRFSCISSSSLWFTASANAASSLVFSLVKLFTADFTTLSLFSPLLLVAFKYQQNLKLEVFFPGPLTLYNWSSSATTYYNTDKFYHRLANILPSIGDENNIAQPKADQCLSSHLSVHRLTVVKVSFCSLIKLFNPKIRLLCLCPNK